eukprot:7351790-Alexandrium_andersonii.AAC.1
MVRADAVSAFPHAKLQAGPVYVKCPEEIYDRPEILAELKEKGIEPFWDKDDELVLEVSGALYGHRTA